MYIIDLFSPLFSEHEKQYSRLRTWKDVGEGDIRIFLAHLIAMGLVRQSTIERYWEHGETVKTPFFGTYMSRNTFQNILSNFQVVDKTQFTDAQKREDLLYKIRPFIDMMDRTFRQSYRPGRDLSVDEGCCPFKGKVSFRVYNPKKPNKFHMKYYALNDSQTGYCLGLEVYTGKTRTRCANNAQTLDPNCGETTKIVFGLLQKCELLDQGHQLYMDNYYSSPELFEELHRRHTYCTGTLKSTRKNVSKAVRFAKLKTGECVWRRAGPLLLFKWKEKKKDVLMLSTIHDAVMVETPKRNYLNQPIVKPEAVYHYCKKMGGVDLNDQLLNYYSFLRKSVKWSRKLLIHFFNLVVLNAHILNKYYGTEKLSHDQYRDRIVKFLLGEGLKCYRIPLPPVLSRKIGKRNAHDHEDKRLHERHFPTTIPAGEGRKRKRPCRECVVCNKLPGLDITLPTKRTSYWCEDCGKALCVTPCFEIFHTKPDYKRSAIDFRINQIAMPAPVSPD